MTSFTWGDTIQVKPNAPTCMRPSAVAEIVGIREVETAEQAVQFDAPLGTKIYLIEFGDGNAKEVVETWIEPMRH